MRSVCVTSVTALRESSSVRVCCWRTYCMGAGASAIREEAAKSLRDAMKMKKTTDSRDAVEREPHSSELVHKVLRDRSK